MKMNPFESLLESYGKLRKQTYKFSTSELLNEARIPKVLADVGITSTDIQEFEKTVYRVPKDILSLWAEKQIIPNVSTPQGEDSVAQPGDIEVREDNPNSISLHTADGRTKSLQAHLSDKFLAYLEYNINKGQGEGEEVEPQTELGETDILFNETMIAMDSALDKLGIPGSRELMENKLRFNMSEPGQKITTDINRVLSLTTGLDLETPSDDAYQELLQDLKSLADIANDITDDGCIKESENSKALQSKFFMGSPGRASDALMYGNLETDSDDGSSDNEPLLLQQMRGFEGDLGLDMQGVKAFENFQGVLVAPGRQSAVRNLGVKLSNMKMCESGEPFLQKQTTVSPTGGFYKVRGELNEMSVTLTKAILATQKAKASGDEDSFNKFKTGLAKIFIAIGKAIDVKRETLNKLVEMSFRLDATINGEGFNHPLLEHAMSDVENYGTVFADAPDLVKIAFAMAMKDAESLHWKAIVRTGTLDDVEPVLNIQGISANKMTGPLEDEIAAAIGGGNGDTNKADSFLKIGSIESRKKICDELRLSNSERERIIRTGLLPISDKFSTAAGENTDLGNQSLTTLTNPNTWSKLTEPLSERGADPVIINLAKETNTRLHNSQTRYTSMMDKDAPKDRADDSTAALEFQNTRSHVKGRLEEYSLSKYGAQHPIKKMADETLALMEKFNAAYQNMDFSRLEGRDLRKAREKYNAAKRDIVTNMMKMDEMDYLEKLSGPQREKEDKAFAMMTSLAGTDTNPFSILNTKNFSDMNSKQVTSAQMREAIAGITTGEYAIKRDGFTCVILKNNKPLMSCKIRNRKGSQTTTCSIDSEVMSTVGTPNR